MQPGAARKLDVTPAAISQALLRLQNLYGEELFIRTRKGLVPSSKGKSLHRVFRQAIESIESTLCDKTDAQESNELIVLGGDITENYYFPALLDTVLMNRYIIKHYAIKKTGEYSPASMLTHGYADVIMGILEIKNEMIESYLIDNLSDFVCVCGEKVHWLGLKKCLYIIFMLPDMLSIIQICSLLSPLIALIYSRAVRLMRGAGK